MGTQKLYPRGTVKRIVKAHANRNVSKNADILVSYYFNYNIGNPRSGRNELLMVLFCGLDFLGLYAFHARVSRVPVNSYRPLRFEAIEQCAFFKPNHNIRHSKT